MILTSECSRYQFRNLAQCLQKIRDMIAEASQPSPEPSQESSQERAALHKARYGVTSTYVVCEELGGGGWP